MSNLFSVSVLLPEQYDEMAHHRGERDLVAALLEGALHDLRLPPCAAQDKARTWVLFGKVGRFTFDDCCEFLGLVPQEVRERALRGVVTMNYRNARGLRRRNAT